MTPAEKVLSSLGIHPLLEGVPLEARRTLLEWGKIETFAPKKYLSREGDPANDYWFLCAGSVKVFYTSPEGFEVIVKIFRAPAAWAEMEMLTDQHHIEDCVAVDKALVLRVPKRKFEQFLDAYPRFTRNVLYDTCARFLIAAQNEKALAFLPVGKRLANLLLSYVRMYGVPMEKGVGIRIKLSQTDLANGLGAAKRSVTRILSEWQAAGILSKSGTSYVVHDLERLARLSSQDLIGIDWISGTRVSDAKGVKRRGG